MMKLISVMDSLSRATCHPQLLVFGSSVAQVLSKEKRTEQDTIREVRLLRNSCKNNNFPTKTKLSKHPTRTSKQ